jgi:fatty acid desaturase
MSYNVFGPWWLYPLIWCVSAAVLTIANVIA